MNPANGKKDLQRKAESLPSIDRRVLLGTLALVLGGFTSAWIGARGFLPGAQLFPYVVAGIGSALTVVALIRVWRGREPSSRPGETAGSTDQSRAAYRMATKLICGISGYFLTIYLVGFMPATALFVVVFARTCDQSYVYAVGAATAALAVVYMLSISLDLFLPHGLIVQMFMGG